MENGEIVKEYMLVKTFQDKAMKCRTHADMLLFCESFLKKHAPEKAEKHYPKDLGKNLGTVFLAAGMDGSRHPVTMESLTAVVSSDNTRFGTAGWKAIPTHMKEKQKHEAKLMMTEKFVRDLFESDYIDITEEQNYMTNATDYKARLIVGKRSQT